jgi:hypothetical protein
VSADRRRIAGAPESGLVFDVDPQAACATRLRMFDRMAIPTRDLRCLRHPMTLASI